MKAVKVIIWLQVEATSGTQYRHLTDMKLFCVFCENQVIQKNETDTCPNSNETQNKVIQTT
jgi:hypothetical protein